MALNALTLRIPTGKRFADLEGSVKELANERNPKVEESSQGGLTRTQYSPEGGTITWERKPAGEEYEFRQVVKSGDRTLIDRTLVCSGVLTAFSQEDGFVRDFARKATEYLGDYIDTTLNVSNPKE